MIGSVFAGALFVTVLLTLLVVTMMAWVQRLESQLVKAKHRNEVVAFSKPPQLLEPPQSGMVWETPSTANPEAVQFTFEVSSRIVLLVVMIPKSCFLDASSAGTTRLVSCQRASSSSAVLEAHVPAPDKPVALSFASAYSATRTKWVLYPGQTYTIKIGLPREEIEQAVKSYSPNAEPFLPFLNMSKASVSGTLQQFPPGLFFNAVVKELVHH